MSFSTPTYTRMNEIQKEQLRKAKNNDIDVFVNVVNAARREPAEVKMPVSIGFKPEVVQRVRQTEKKKVQQSQDRGFIGGMIFAGMLVAVFILLVVM